MFNEINNISCYKNFIIVNDTDAFSVQYMNDYGYYTKVFSLNDKFWELHSHYFQDSFKIFQEIISRTLIHKNIDSIIYEIYSETNECIYVKIYHTSQIGMDWEIILELDNDTLKVKALEENMKILQEKVKKLELENKELRNKTINDEKWIIQLNPAEKDREYSSVWNNDKSGGYHANSCLDSNSCWSAKINDKKQWMILDLKEIKEIRGFIIQGRYNYGYEQQVNKLMFLISDDKVIWTNCGEYECKAIDNDNYEEYGQYINPKRKVILNIPLKSRYVKVVPTEWENHISMRFALIIKGKTDKKERF